MEHRGACSADNDSGDGAGVMTAVPWDLLKAECADLELHDKTTGCVDSGIAFAAAMQQSAAAICDLGLLHASQLG